MYEEWVRTLLKKKRRNFYVKSPLYTLYFICVLQILIILFLEWEVIEIILSNYFIP